MTKKDYELIAKIMKDMKPNIGAYNHMLVVTRLAEAFKKDREAFSYEKFITASNAKL